MWIVNSIWFDAKDTEWWQCHQLGLGVVEENIRIITRLLRKSMVEEWEHNLDLYQGYLTATVSQTFLQNGGDTGDLMVLTLSNILRLPITKHARCLCDAHIST